MSVKVNEVVGVAGFVVPGTKVDLLVTLRRNEDSMTRTVVSNVQVLTAGTPTTRRKQGRRADPSTVVTLMVSPRTRRKSRWRTRGPDHAGAAEPSRHGSRHDTQGEPQLRRSSENPPAPVIKNR